MISREPLFAVVGHVNKGKSSVVATLAEDDTVAISRDPGTTTRCRRFPLRVDGETLLTFVDTPGFEQARHALAWIQQRGQGATERRAAVEAFVREPGHRERFPEECELLAPVLEGAGILYVVDGSRPYSPEYEAQMEILRYTGQPRVALINRIGPEDHSATWQKALDQYFGLVRTFDAHAAGFVDRVRLLEALRELHEPWRPAIERAIAALTRERDRQRRAAARAVAAMVAGMLGATLERRLRDGDDPAAPRAELEAALEESLRARERQGRIEVERIYQHRELARDEPALPWVDEDLFSEATWLRLGLSRRDLAATGAVSGALIGGTFDAMVGGHSFLLGSLIGGAVGGLTGWFARDQLAKATVSGLPLGGRLVRIGPVRNPQFPWVALDRALLHLDAVQQRAHARRGKLELGGGGGDGTGKRGVVSTLDLRARRALQATFDQLRKDPRDEAAIAALAERLHALAGEERVSSSGTR